MKALIFDIKRFAIHDGPGIRTTIFFKGCPLKCPWCHNPEGISPVKEIVHREERCIRCSDCISVCSEKAISLDKNGIVVNVERCTLCGECEKICPTCAIEIIGKEVELEELIKIVERDRSFYKHSNGGVTLSGGEPLMQCEFILEFLKRCRERGIHTAVDTSGYTSKECMAKVSELADLILFDIKSLNDNLHKKFTGVSNKIIIENLKLISSRGAPIIIRVPLIKGVNDSEDEIISIANFIVKLRRVEKVSILPFHKGWYEKFKLVRRDYRPYLDGGTAENEFLKKVDILRSAGLEVSIGG